MTTLLKNSNFKIGIVLCLCFWTSVQSAVVPTDTSRTANTASRIQLTLDTSEADEVLAILTLRSESKPIGDKEWQRLFATEPYQRLKKREKIIAQYLRDTTRMFTDDAFKAFVLSEDLLKRAQELRATLDRWKKTNLQIAAEQILHYLPDSAKIRAKIYPIIKPRENSFVWEASTDPAIFLYLNPTVTGDEFTNTASHEFHHIGLSSLGSFREKTVTSLGERARTVAQLIGAFGEGMAMLAAAGSPDIHPHAVSAQEDRARWDNDMENFNTNLCSVDSFFINILDGSLSGQDAIQEKAFSFFGVQGPWYTVGYKMSVMVEKKFGRAALIQTMLDPRQLLALYNRAAKEFNAVGKNQLAVWSEEVLKQVGVE